MKSIEKERDEVGKVSITTLLLSIIDNESEKWFCFLFNRKKEKEWK